MLPQKLPVTAKKGAKRRLLSGVLRLYIKDSIVKGKRGKKDTQKY